MMPKAPCAGDESVTVEKCDNGHLVTLRKWSRMGDDNFLHPEETRRVFAADQRAALHSFLQEVLS